MIAELQAAWWKRQDNIGAGQKWIPKELIPIGHMATEPGKFSWTFDLSANHKPVTRIMSPSSQVHIWRRRRRKGVKANRLPRGSRRTTGIWNGQNVADMVTR